MASAPSSKSLAEASKALYQNGEWSDLTITSGSRTWKVHRAILCTRCDFFKVICAGGFQEAQSQTIKLDDDPEDGIDMMLEYLYTLQIPALNTFDHMKMAYTLGDKYDLPKLRDAGLEALCRHLQDRCASWDKQSALQKSATASVIEEVWTWTYQDTNKFKKAILDGLCASSARVVEDPLFQEMMSRNSDLALEFMKALTRRQAELEAMVKPTINAPKRKLERTLLEKMSDRIAAKRKAEEDLAVRAQRAAELERILRRRT